MSTLLPFTDRLFLSLPLGLKSPPVHAGAEQLEAIDFGIAEGGWHVPVPGWAWRAVKPGADLKLSIGRGLIRKSAVLRRTMLSERLSQLAQTAHADVPIFDLISALEHAHHAQGIFETLAEPVQAYLYEAAALTGLPNIFAASGKAVCAPLPSIDSDPVARRFVTDFGAARQTDKAADDLSLLRQILAQSSLSTQQRREVALDLTPQFCMSMGPETLYAELLDDDLNAIAPNESADWQGSHCLPGRVLAGDLDTSRHIFNDLIANPGRWAATPAIGWSLRYIADPQTTTFDSDGRMEILMLGLRYLDALNADYFGVSRCRELMRAVVCMIERRHHFLPDLETNLIWTTLRCYGASPEFWRMLRGATGALPLELRAAEQSFIALEGAAENFQSGDLADDAIKGLSRFGVADAARIRHDLFGGFGVSNTPKLSLGKVVRDTINPRDAILRGLAAPLSSPLTDLTPDVVQDAILRAYQHTPAAPFANLAGQTGAAARALINAVKQDPRSAHEQALSTLVDNLATLCGPQANHRGVGLGLAVLSDLADQGDTTVTTAFSNRFALVLRSAAKQAQESFLNGPWPSSTASRLAQRHPNLFEMLCLAVPELRNINRSNKENRSENSDWEQPTALNDTLIVVQTSQAGLQDRIPGLRQGWLAELKALDVPLLITTGAENPQRGARPRLSEEVLELPFSDSADDAPSRLLALLDWIHETTDFAHVTVIDDNTHLAVMAWFTQQNYRMSDFYGQLATLWEKDGLRRSHQPAAQAVRAAHGFEKLPRNLNYADGRFGLTLSRRAIESLSEVMASPEGQILRLSGFAPDRLLAAALQVANIWPMGAGLHASGFEPDHSGNISVPKSLNGFGLLNTMAGMTGHHSEKVCQVIHGKPTPPPASLTGLWPRKLWASHAPARLGHFSNALHLISSEQKLRSTPDVTVITVLRNERFILPHFLAHYRNLGVERFLVADNGSTDGSVGYLNDQPDVVLFSAENEFRHTNQGTDWKIALMQRYCQNSWALVADADEFLVYPKYETQSLANYLARYDGSGIDAVRVLMLDMYPKGLLADAKLIKGSPFEEAGFADRDAFLHNSLGRGPYSNASTVTSGLRHRMMPGSRPELFVTQKVPLFRYKPWMRFSVSLHYASEINLAIDDLLFAHFKYHADFRMKAEREVARGQYFNNAEEYRKYLALVAEGQDRLFDPALSVPWCEVAAVRTILERQS